MKFGGGGERVEILDRMVGNGLTGTVTAESHGIASLPGAQ